MNNPNYKDLAIEIMQDLGIYKPYINGLKSKKERVCFFDGYAGYWVEQEKEVYEKMKSIENAYNVFVYAITHEYVGSYECWSFLCIPKDRWCPKEQIFEKGKNKRFAVFAYVWNKTFDYFSEFGEIFVHSFGGGITRIS